MTRLLDRPAHLRARFLDWFLGPRCPVCWFRVYPKDQAGHDEKWCD